MTTAAITADSQGSTNIPWEVTRYSDVRLAGQDYEEYLTPLRSTCPVDHSGHQIPQATRNTELISSGSIQEESQTQMSIDVTFKRGIAEWQDMCHGLMVEKGFWDKERNVPEMLALIHSEVSEALEAHRRSNYIGFAEELADIVYRVLDMAGGLGVDLEQELENKHDKNCLRPYKHGKNY